ncbi:MAG: hypothetical protein HEQ32_06495 [Vampirovibrio sp.]
MFSLTEKYYSTKAQAFNLIEVSLSLVFFGLAFSALLLGVQSIIAGNLDATQMGAENIAVNEILNGIDFYRLDVERQFDITANKKSIAIGNNANNKKLFYQLNVYSQAQYPDIKIADLTLYKSANTNTIYRQFQRKMNLTTECHNYGATQVLKYNDVTCIPVPTATDATSYATASLTSTVNRANSTETDYTGTGTDFFLMNADLTLFEPKNENVWGGFIVGSNTTANGTEQGNYFDYDTTLVTPINDPNSVLGTGMKFSKANKEPTTNTNVRLVMPASSNTFQSNMINSNYRYSVEFGASLTTSDYLRVYPICQNATAVGNGLAYIDYPMVANQIKIIRLDNLIPGYDIKTDRGIVGVNLLAVSKDSSGVITYNTSDVTVTHMIKRPYSEG